MENQDLKELHFGDVTLLITHYNRSTSLKRLLDAMKELGISFSEIIVSDDCSKSDHLDQLLLWKTEYPFTLVSAEKNGGLGNNLNKGIERVTTPYTLYVQEDFVPEPLFKEVMVRAKKIMDKEADIDVVRFYAYNKYPYLKPYNDEFSEMIYKPWFTHTGKIYQYSDHPHLRRATFTERFGKYRENIKSDKTEYLMCVSFLQQKGKGLFFNDYKSVFAQENSAAEPSTVKRSNWRQSDNAVIKIIRLLYRELKYNFDIHLGTTLHNKK